MFYFAVCCTRCPCHCLHAWVVSHRLQGYLPCVFMRLALVCFYCLCVFVYVFYFIATMSFAGYFLSVLFCLLPMLISDSRFDLVWFRLSCDHGWIRSGSVNVKKQQQQQENQLLGVSVILFLVRSSCCLFFLSVQLYCFQHVAADVFSFFYTVSSRSRCVCFFLPSNHFARQNLCRTHVLGSARQIQLTDRKK